MPRLITGLVLSFNGRPIRTMLTNALAIFLKTSMPHISAFEATFKAAEEVYAINHWAACALIRAAIEEAAK